MERFELEEAEFPVSNLTTILEAKERAGNLFKNYELLKTTGGKNLLNYRDFWSIDPKIIEDGIYLKSATSLENFIKCPLNWFLEEVIKLKESPAIHLASENQIIGELVHRVIYYYLAELEGEQKFEIDYKSIEQKIKDLLEKSIQEEAIILRLPELAAKQEEICYALIKTAQYLTHFLSEKQLKIMGREYEVKAQTEIGEIEGKLDLYLKGKNKWGPHIIIDLKWRGKQHFKEFFPKVGPLQLAIYARLLKEKLNDWPYTGIFFVSTSELYLSLIHI